MTRNGAATVDYFGEGSVTRRRGRPPRHEYTGAAPTWSGPDQGIACGAGGCLYVGTDRGDMERHRAEPGECPRLPDGARGIVALPDSPVRTVGPGFRAPTGEYCRGCDRRGVGTLAGLCARCAPALHAAVSRAAPDVAPHASPTFAPAVPSLCLCRGCYPRVLDDGRRPRGVVLGGEQNFGSALPMRSRRSVRADLDAAASRAGRATTGRACGVCRNPGHNARTCGRRRASQLGAIARAAVALVEYGEAPQGGY